MIYNNGKNTAEKNAVSLKNGSEGVISAFSCGKDRSERLRALGLTEGTKVRCLYQRKGIAAYLVRGALIGIRDEDARDVLIDSGELTSVE